MGWNGVERRTCEPQACHYEDTIKDIHVAIYGNGHPENGLIWKVTSNTDFIQKVQKVFWHICAIAITGSLSAVGLFVMQVYEFMVRHK